MTMIINKNVNAYVRYVALKALFKTYTEEDLLKMVAYVNENFKNIRVLDDDKNIQDEFVITTSGIKIEDLKKFDIKLFTTIEGIDEQIEKFSSPTNFVYFLKLEDDEVKFDRIALVAKEVDDD